MAYRPLSFTKNLGGYRQLHQGIRAAYRPGTTLPDFRERLKSNFGDRDLLISEFFVATRLVDGVEYVVEDALISTSLGDEYATTTARLYLFAMLLNMPGQRKKTEHRSPAEGQNEYVRSILHDGNAWRSSKINKDEVLGPWVRSHFNVSGEQTARKIANNFYFFFESAKFDVNQDGYLVTYANDWGPLALRLFFDRYRIHFPEADASQLMDAAAEHELHRLMGVDRTWLDETVPGAAMLYLSGQQEMLVAAPEQPAQEVEPPGRKTHLITRLNRSSENVLRLHDWYAKKCQVCGNVLSGKEGEPIIEIGHIRPLGSPHNGPDRTSNMLSMCPNHHRQFDRGGLRIGPHDHIIEVAADTDPPTLIEMYCHPSHEIDARYLEYHAQQIYRP